MPSTTNCSGTRSPTTRNWPRPPLLFGAAVFAAIGLLLGREFLPPREAPAFAVAPAGEIRVALGEGFPEPGIRQFSDGMVLGDVMELTGQSAALSGPLALAGGERVLADGMALAIAATPGGTRELRVGWMPARQRLALGIPLHPDRMSQADWVTLPGIGEQLAAAIVADRQNYGDFGRFAALERVKGIGPAKLKALRPFFTDKLN